MYDKKEETSENKILRHLYLLMTVTNAVVRPDANRKPVDARQTIGIIRGCGKRQSSLHFTNTSPFCLA